MAYSESLAQRVRQALSFRAAVQEKRMFGGVGFFVRGNLCVAIWKTSLVVRVGPDRYAAALQTPHVREFDITGRPMIGWVLVAAEALDTDRDLDQWIEQAFSFAGSLPAKASHPARRRNRRIS